MSHLTVGFSEDALDEQLRVVQENTSVSVSGELGGGAFSFDYAIGGHLEEGTIDLRPGRFDLDELDIVYDPLSFGVNIDIPEFCVGGCVDVLGWDVCTPRVCAFEADPDLSFDIDLGGIVETEISLLLGVMIEFFDNPNRPPDMTDLEAHETGLSDAWHIYLDVVDIDLDVIDWADTIGNALEAALGDEVQALIDELPSAVGAVISAADIFDTIRNVLDFPDDIGEWLADQHEITVGLKDAILTEIADGFAEANPFALPTPYPVLPATVAETAPGTISTLVPVLVPIERPSIELTEEELLVRVDVGA
jgi:hypothetical protein